MLVSVCVCVCVSRPSLFLSRIRNDVNFKLNVKMTQLTLQFRCLSCHSTTQTKSVVIQKSQAKASQQHGMAENTKMC